MCATYREACQQLHLLEDDTHWDATLRDASISSTPNQIRMLFAIIISKCFPSNPLELWNKYKDFMAEDILIRLQHRSNDPALLLPLEMYNEALIMIEDLSLTIANKALGQLGLTQPNRPMHDLFERELQRQQQFDRDELRALVQTYTPQLNDQQKDAYDKVMQAVNDNTGGLYFLDAPGGTGKTFLISLILATIRSERKIALALASSGIAATLLDDGHTAHSALKLPLNMQDECPMAHKKSLEALSRTLQDLRQSQQLFGGALILLSGDFRQTLPVISISTTADEINACLKSSFLWEHVQRLSLTTNMRVRLQNDSSAREFSKQLLKIGDGKIASDQNGFIMLPNSFCIIVSSKQELIDRVFPNIVQNYNNHDWLRKRAILAPKNINVNEINFHIHEKLPGDSVMYKSIDTAMNNEDAVNYPVEYLNSLKPPGKPPGNLNFKVGSSIILLRNLNAPKLCNGTRLSVKKLMPNLIQATILTGKAKGEIVPIPRIPLIPTDMSFEFKRLQFPVRLSFAMTVNKAKGQTLQDLSLEKNLETVYCSRATRLQPQVDVSSKEALLLEGIIRDLNWHTSTPVTPKSHPKKAAPAMFADVYVKPQVRYSAKETGGPVELYEYGTPYYLTEISN
ncbi:ATP-dependent DNA helicase pif1-like [Anastrepha obliqua]|uniref:ATP-dependent DNA helicase pif1-like n=1 Tax=Anastrepha obliqua TaxID=95512 RepID=UPI0024097EDD|nr:ATP-dependent DNA helicase pif1-like [Anastrepha obliqua]